MKRIAVIGCCGAGKSWLSIQLSEKLGLPVYHLDKLLWKPGWVERDRIVQTQSNIYARTGGN